MRTPATSGLWAVRASGKGGDFAAGSFMNFLAGFLIILAVYSGAQGFLIPAAAGTRRSLRSGTARLSRPEIFLFRQWGAGVPVQ